MGRLIYVRLPFNLYVDMYMVLLQMEYACDLCLYESKTAKKDLLKGETHQILSDLNSHTTEPQGFCLISS